MITSLFNHDNDLLGVIIEKIEVENIEQILVAFNQNENCWIAKKMQLKPSVTLLSQYENAKLNGVILSAAEARKRFSLYKEGLLYDESGITNH